MKPVLAIVVILIIAAGFYFVFSPTRTQAPARIAEPAPQAAPAPAAEPPPLLPMEILGDDVAQHSPEAVMQVEIKNFSFSPAEIRIAEGTHVIWINKDATRHSVVTDKGGFGSVLLGTGDNYEFAFEKKGIYLYHCGPHPYMKGKIIVE